MEKTTLKVTGMSCGHCEKAVKTALLELEGVKDVNVSLSTGLVDVEYDAANVSMDQMKEAVEDQGYDVA
jgi:copper chaperone